MISGDYFLKFLCSMITLHDLYPPTGHRQTDLVAIVRVQGRWQGCVTHSGWQGDSSILIASLCPFPSPCPCLVFVLHQGDCEKEDRGRNEDGDQGALHFHDYDDDDDGDDNGEDEVENDDSDEDDVGDQGAVHHQAQLQR